MKDETAFANKGRHGNFKLRSRCKDCYKAARQRRLSGQLLPLEKMCSICGQRKPLAAFHKSPVCLYGVESYCKACKAEKRRTYNTLYPQRVRDSDLKGMYGITVEEYQQMLAQQDGLCAICGVGSEDGAEPLVVDHNHTTGSVRGLLCALCNALVGYAREDIAILARAAAYLYEEQHPEQRGEAIGGLPVYCTLPLPIHTLQPAAVALSS
jgi:hypothetical protein